MASVTSQQTCDRKVVPDGSLAIGGSEEARVTAFVVALLAVARKTSSVLLGGRRNGVSPLNNMIVLHYTSYPTQGDDEGYINMLICKFIHARYGGEY